MKSLFISYNGALEPLIRSQGIPYLKGLSKRGVKCFLLSFEKPYIPLRWYNESLKKLKRELDNHGIKWYRLRYHKRPSLPATLFDIFMGIIVGTYLVISKKIDIVHARATVPAAMGYAISKITRKRFIYDERGLTAEEYVDGGMWKKGSMTYKLTLYFEKLFLTHADKVVVLTENIKDFLLSSDYLVGRRRITHSNITVIPCCVDIEKFGKDNIPTGDLREKYKLSSKLVFLYIGSLGTWYLLDEMLDFFVAAKDAIKNAHFLILTHADKKIAEQSCRRKGLSFEDVTIDQAKFDEMPHYIRLADVGMFFIKPVFSKRSSCPTKFAEYLACGLPVVINSGIGDTDTIVERNRLGVVVKDFGMESYSGAINCLLGLLKDRTSVSARCNRIANEIFSLEEGVSKYFDIYKG